MKSNISVRRYTMMDLKVGEKEIIFEKKTNKNIDI
jgi:hypothetical protein